MQGAHDEVSSARGLEDQDTQPASAGSAPVSPATPAEDPAIGSHRQQRTSAEKPPQDTDSLDPQPVIDLNATAGLAQQVCTCPKLSPVKGAAKVIGTFFAKTC